jgi:hypothetical protein
VFDPPFAKEVVANTKIGMDKIAGAQQESEPCRIHDNVAVVGHEEGTVADVPLDELLVAMVRQLNTMCGLTAHDQQDGAENKKIYEWQNPA